MFLSSEEAPISPNHQTSKHPKYPPLKQNLPAREVNYNSASSTYQGRQLDLIYNGDEIFLFLNIVNSISFSDNPSQIPLYVSINVDRN